MEKESSTKGEGLGKEMEKYMTVKEVAEHLRISNQSVYNKLNGGVLEYSRVGGRLLIPYSAVKRLITKGTVKATSRQET